VFGAIHNAESCAYDPVRGVIVVPNRAAAQRVLANDAFVSFIKHDGSVHTARRIGVQPPAARRALTPPLTLNDPFGSEIAGGLLYVADSDGNTSADDPRVAVIRKFDLRTGAPAGEVRVAQAEWLNDLAVARDGTIYATRTGDFGPTGNPATWQVLKVAPDGAVTVFAEGAPLRMPNGVALDPQGNVVVANSGDSAVVTFSPAGRVLRTEAAAQAGSDGLVIMPDGTKYVSSVFQGGVSRIRPGRPAELIARNIPSAASMCYDAGANQLVIPMNEQNGLAFVRLR
jgi:DNA-binding beta-propeller fold protein YncE